MSRASIRIRTGEHRDGGWTLASRPADPRLGRHLSRNPVGFAEWGGSPLRWVDMPAPTASLIFSCGDSFGGLPRAFAVGLSDSWSLVDLGEPSTSLDFKLTPTGAHQLLGLPMDELGGRAVDLTEILGSTVEPLLDRLAEAPGWDRRFDLAERFLLDRAERHPPSDPAVEWAFWRLLRTRGRLPIAELVREVGWSHRHLISRFRSQVGLAPKTVARVIRFRHLLGRLRSPGTELAQLAYDCGYADQSHLNRDFREFTGTTPARYLATRSRVESISSKTDPTA